MAIYILRRTFAEGEDSKKSGLGKKLAIGGALAGLGFLGAQKGVFGAGLQKSSNTALMNVGKTVGSQGLQNAGMKGLAKGQAKSIMGAAKDAGRTVSKEAATKSGEAFAKAKLDKINGTGLWDKNTQSVMKEATNVQKANSDLTKAAVDVGNKANSLDNPAVNQTMKTRLQEMSRIKGTPPPIPPTTAP